MELGSNIGHGMFVGWLGIPATLPGFSASGGQTYLPDVFVLSAEPSNMVEDRIIPTAWSGICRFIGVRE